MTLWDALGGVLLGANLGVIIAHMIQGTFDTRHLANVLAAGVLVVSLHLKRGRT